MCGIVGIYSLDSTGSIPEQALESMRDTMVHRGPDGAGMWVSNDRRAGLAHRRLSIIDLSTQADQPMCNEDGALWVVFNGEIYNHLSLRRELESKGHYFKTDHSDTETIIHGYEAWGNDVWTRLHGMFAVAVFDLKTGSLTLARDRVGIKPLYFTLQKGLFIFASEIKSILAHQDVHREICFPALYHYLTFMTTPAPMTMFQDIFKLPAGHVLQLDKNGALHCHRYWDALPDPKAVEEAQKLSGDALEDFFVQGIQERLTRAVEKRMMADVPMGVFLSGGIDSSTNVALMRKFMDRPVDTFTVGFKDHEELNELTYADAVARHFNTNHHQVLIDENDMASYLDELIHTQDEPIADWVCIPLYFVSKLAREHGVKVIQVGEGSDEQFCGYDHYLSSIAYYQRVFSRIRSMPAFIRKSLSAAARALAPFGERHLIRADTFDRAARDRELFWSGAYVFGEMQKHRMFGALSVAQPTPAEQTLIACGLLPAQYLLTDSYEVIRDFREEFERAAPSMDIMARMAYYEFKLRLPELLLMRVDKITMSVSLEARVPFLDHELVAFSMSIPIEWRVRERRTKYLLKKAVQNLIPGEIIHRPKMGFGAPMSQWLRNDFGRQVEATLLSSGLLDRCGFNRAAVKKLIQQHREGRADTSVSIWTLFNLAAWYDYWIDSKAHR